MSKIRLLIADDHAIFREGLCELLSKEDDLECVAVVGNGKDAVSKAQESLPDVAILDIEMPGMDGIEATKEIKKSCPNVAVLILSAFVNNPYIVASLEAGVNGYLLKDISRSELINVVRLIHSGKSVFNQGIDANRLLHKMATQSADKPSTSGSLKKREIEILRLAMDGLSNKEIATQLGITPHTVETHFINIFRKLGVQSRLQATIRGLKEGWLSLNESTV